LAQGGTVEGASDAGVHLESERLTCEWLRRAHLACARTPVRSMAHSPPLPPELRRRRDAIPR